MFTDSTPNSRMKAMIVRIIKCAMVIWMFGILFLEFVTYQDSWLRSYVTDQDMWIQSLWDWAEDFNFLVQAREFVAPFFSGR